MKENDKKTIVMYGNPSTFSKSDNCRYIIVEPRKQHIDYIRNSNFKSAVTLIPKALVGDNVLKEIKLSSIIDTHNADLNSTQKCFCTSLQNIIVSYEIDCIEELIINIGTNNIKDVLQNAFPFVNIFKKITFAPGTTPPEGTFLSKFQNPEDRVFVNRCSDKKILIMFPPQHSLTANFTRFKAFVKQYNLLYMDNNGHFSPTNNIHLWPKQIGSHSTFPEMLVENLEKYFQHSSQTDISVEYIILFNNAYLSSNYTLNIDMDLTETQICVHQQFDIMYATKNCWYTIYQILRSQEFTDYLKEKGKGKGVLVRIMCKRWMWEYLGKSFDVLYK